MWSVRVVAACVLTSVPLLAQKKVEFFCPPWEAGFWWDCNRSQFVAPRRGLTPAELALRIRLAGPVVRAQLRAATDPELIACSLVALARMAAADPHAFGTDGAADAGEPVPDIDTLVRPWLRHASSDVREGAAMALATGGGPTALALLVALVGDTAVGREACGVEPVPLRLRAFALYGSGLLARRLGADEDWRVRGVAGDLLQQAPPGDIELQVAAVSALSLLRPVPAPSPWPQGTAAMQELERFGDRADVGALARSHVPTAVARLWRTAREAGRQDLDALVRAQRGRWLATLTEPAKRPEKDDFEAQSAVLALGDTMPDDATERLGCVPALVRAARDLRDPAARLMAILALGRAGGTQARDELLVRLCGREHYEPAWAALALGLLERSRRGHGPPDEAIVAALSVEPRRPHPTVRAACAIAFALAGTIDRAPLAEVAAKSWSKDDLAVALCEAIGMSAQSAWIPVLHDVLGRATRRPNVFVASAEALHALDDRSVAGHVLKVALDEQARVVAPGSIALAVVGDDASVQALVRELEAAAATPLRRAFWTVALGRLCAASAGACADDLQRGQNWLATVPTLSNRQNGVLDVW